MCILDVFFPLDWKKTCHGSEIHQNLKIDQCMKKISVEHVFEALIVNLTHILPEYSLLTHWPTRSHSELVKYGCLDSCCQRLKRRKKAPFSVFVERTVGEQQLRGVWRWRKARQCYLYSTVQQQCNSKCFTLKYSQKWIQIECNELRKGSVTKKRSSALI